MLPPKTLSKPSFRNQFEGLRLPQFCSLPHPPNGNEGGVVRGARSTPQRGGRETRGSGEARQYLLALLGGVVAASRNPPMKLPQTSFLFPCGCPPSRRRRDSFHLCGGLCPLRRKKKGRRRDPFLLLVSKKEDGPRLSLQTEQSAKGAFCCHPPGCPLLFPPKATRGWSAPRDPRERNLESILCQHARNPPFGRV
ncbi:hypothetical protein RRG08_057347 [Elysia crispata]|uniref:Uncharacterized protein n=1 Tax=Elysia crispata TaxID=231223 RepID=A0AAE0YJN2_9GAST|nr:hypothetical protein RRG08_057347 [Elysia crispata]